MEKILEIFMSWDLSVVQIVSWVLLITICTLVFLLINNIPVEEVNKDLRRKSKRFRTAAEARMHAAHGGLFDYTKTELFLKSSGAVYALGEWLDPLTYIILRCVVALFFGAVLGTFGVIWFFVGIIVGFVLVPYTFLIYNKSSNDDMLRDIKNMFDTLRIQTRAGVFITRGILECSKVVKTNRLKVALRELYNSMELEANVDAAIMDFETKFDSQHINNFCIIVSQARKSGKSIQLLEDISNQLVDLQSAINMKEKEKLKTRIVMVQVLVYVGVLGLMLYAIVVTLMGALQGL